jgi:tetratricopeptide (TPR) repeat protein
VGLVSAGIVTTGSLLSLYLFAANDGAPSVESMVASEQVTPTVSAPGARPAYEAAWPAIERTGTMAELSAFAQTYPKTSEGVLAEIRLLQLIDGSEDRAALEALRGDAAVRVAERARRRLGMLTGGQPDVTALLPRQSPGETPAANTATPPTEAAFRPEDNATEQPAAMALAYSVPDADVAADIPPAGHPDVGNAAPEDLLASQPADTGGFLQRASGWLARDDTTRAMDDYDAAIRLDDSNIPALHRRGLLWLRLGDVERALADLDHAIRLSFEDARIYRDRGAIWLAKGRYDRAIADLDRAIKLAPDFAQAYFDRGVAYKRKGEPDKAAANFDDAVRQDSALAPASRRAMSGDLDQTALQSAPALPR